MDANLISWLIVLGMIIFVCGVIAGYKLPKYLPTPTKLNSIHSRSEHPVQLRFGYTLGGNFTGELIPAEQDPREAALRKSKQTGRIYGARRITPE